MFYPPLKQYRITQQYGERPWFYKRRNLKGHEGTDFGWPTPGKPVPCFAIARCRVQFIAGNWPYGNRVFAITEPQLDGYQYQILRAHLSRIDVSVGDELQIGDQVGITGATGTSTEVVHLHLGIHQVKNGKVMNTGNGYKGRINPMTVITKSRDQFSKSKYQQIYESEVESPLFSQEGWSQAPSDKETRHLIEIAAARLEKRLMTRILAQAKKIWKKDQSS